MLPAGFKHTSSKLRFMASTSELLPLQNNILLEHQRTEFVGLRVVVSTEQSVVARLPVLQVSTDQHELVEEVRLGDRKCRGHATTEEQTTF